MSLSPTVEEDTGPARAPDEEKDRARVYVGAEAWAAEGATPRGLLGGAASLALGANPSGWQLLGGRLSFAHAPERSFDVEGGRARLGWSTARLEACALRYVYVQSVSFGPCVGVAYGALHGGAESGNDPQDVDPTWGDTSMALRALVLLGGSFHAHAGWLLAFPMTRVDYAWDDAREPFHRTPAVVMIGNLGLGVSIL